MQIFVSHSTAFNYEAELYRPIRRSELEKQHYITFPHEHGSNFNTQKAIEESDLIIAEVSYPSTGQGIELGWAYRYKVPIICIYKKGQKYSHSLKFISNHFVEYENSQTMAETLQKYLLENL